MLQALAAEQIDVAFLLTESALLARSKGIPIEIVSVFVESPLLWGVFTGARGKIESLEQGQTYAISRFNSGSHLMAIMEAEMRGKKIEEKDWRLVSDLEGARRALADGEADLFFWEKWTTSPLVESGEFRMISVFPSPWPAFVLCARSAFMEDSGIRKKLKDDYQSVCSLAADLKMRNADSVREIAEFYGISNDKISEWLAHVSWNSGKAKTGESIYAAEKKLIEAGIISPEIPYQEFSFRREL